LFFFNFPVQKSNTSSKASGWLTYAGRFHFWSYTIRTVYPRTVACTALIQLKIKAGQNQYTTIDSNRDQYRQQLANEPVRSFHQPLLRRS